MTNYKQAAKNHQQNLLSYVSVICSVNKCLLAWQLAFRKYTTSQRILNSPDEQPCKLPIRGRPRRCPRRTLGVPRVRTNWMTPCFTLPTKRSLPIENTRSPPKTTYCLILRKTITPCDFQRRYQDHRRAAIVADRASTSTGSSGTTLYGARLSAMDLLLLLGVGRTRGGDLKFPPKGDTHKSSNFAVVSLEQVDEHV